MEAFEVAHLLLSVWTSDDPSRSASFSGARAVITDRLEDSGDWGSQQGNCDTARPGPPTSSGLSKSCRKRAFHNAILAGAV